MTGSEPAALVRDFETARADRAVWEGHWQTIANLVLPERQFTSFRSPGASTRAAIYDDTAPNNAPKLAGAIYGLLTNPALVWFHLRAIDDDLNTREDVMAWLQAVGRHLLTVFNSAAGGFNTAAYEIYLDMVTFGTAVLYTGPRADGGGVRFQARPLTECYVRESEAGMVDTVYRAFDLTSRQALQKFGDQARAVPSIAKALDDNNPNQLHPFLHAVYPRADRDPRRMTGVNKPFASVYIALEANQRISEGGFDELPYQVPRWSKAAGEIYGRSPAMEALPAIRTVNAMTRSVLIGAEKAVNPPILVESDGLLAPLRTVPNGINYYQSGKNPPRPLEQGGNFAIGQELIGQQRDAIERAFFADLLQTPQRDRMTTVEILQRRGERAQLLAPPVSRMQQEFLSPVVSRVFAIEARAGRLPAPPAELSGRGLRIEYVSPLASLQRSSELDGVERTLAATAQVAQFDPSAVDVLDGEEITRLYAEVTNVPARLIRTRAQVQQRREQAAQAAQAQAALAAAGQLAAAAKDAGAAGAAGAAQGVPRAA